MDADLFNQSIEYELLTRAVYQAILQKENLGTVKVEHNVSIPGRSGVAHQIDVFWEFKQAGVTHRVVIECKNYNQNVNLEKARNLFGVLHDIGNCRGILVTKSGYQSGAAEFCKYYGIDLKLLREPTDEDWKGRIRKVAVNIVMRVPVSTADRPIVCSVSVQPVSEEQQPRLNAALNKNPSLFSMTPSSQFLDKEGTPATEILALWLPKQLNVLQNPDGGPYRKSVELTDRYLQADLGKGPELVKVLGVHIDYFVETLAAQKVVIDAEDTVQAILKDFETGEWEHVHEKPK